MTPKIVFIGSIGTVAETSEIQRQAYNKALKENGVDWEWNVEVYKKLLKSSGGQDRLAMLSEATGKNLTADHITKIHERKTDIAGKKIIEKKIQPRPGVVELITAARKEDVKVVWVTTTGHGNTDAILKAFDGTITADHFDYIFHRQDAENGKPSPDIYQVALKHFNLKPSECIAIEDSLNSALASKGAGIFTVVTPGDYHDEYLKNIADVVVDSLDQTDWETLKTSFDNASK
ncbi:HAD family hydrolase [Nonlabens antarcticus]|uniref:HAD family hydrolase n=1 Tax=Nonlabens antarcticus TaxID=392714 RepID=UPI001891D300|nr:HAD-IA family hydrolase [Nonlabens antarcticus]